MACFLIAQDTILLADSDNVTASTAAHETNKPWRKIDWQKEVLWPEDAGPLADRTDLYEHVDLVFPLFVVHKPNEIYEVVGEKFKADYNPDMGILNDWQACAYTTDKPVSQPLAKIDLRKTHARVSLERPLLEHLREGLSAEMGSTPATSAMTDACRHSLNRNYLILNYKGTKKFSVLYVFVDLTNFYTEKMLGQMLPLYTLGSIVSLLNKARALLDKGGSLMKMALSNRFEFCHPYRNEDKELLHKIGDVTHVLFEYKAFETQYGALSPLLRQNNVGEFIDFVKQNIGRAKTTVARH